MTLFGASVESSRGRILRATSVLGGASIINIVLSIVRMKLAAVTLGPVGVGLIGLFQNFIAVAAGLFSLGVGNSAPKQIAAAREKGGDRGEANARRAVRIASFALALVAAAAIILLREPIARIVFRNNALGAETVVLALAVALTIVGGVQTGILAGLLRVVDVARVSLWSGVLVTLAVLPILFLWRSNAAILFAFAPPMFAALVGWFHLRRVPPRPISDPSLANLASELRALVELGSAMTVAGFLSTAGPLIIRDLVSRHVGPVGLGQFQASWAIASTYLALVLQTMATDYFPRLSGTRSDPTEFSRLLNEQTEVALLLAGPIIIGLICAAPLAVDVLYGSAFVPAAQLLRWQMLGDIFKVASYPLAYALLATGGSRVFMLFEVLATAIFVGSSALLLPRIGLSGAGAGYSIMYLIYLPLVLVAGRTRMRVSWDAAVWRELLLLVIGACAVFIIAPSDALMSGLVGAAVALVVAVRSFLRLRSQDRLNSTMDVTDP